MSGEQKPVWMENSMGEDVVKLTGRRNSLSLSQRGFTLIELLIVMIILGLLAALVAPKMFQKGRRS